MTEQSYDKGVPSESGKTFYKRMAWFTFGFVAGLAPFLGKVKVPGFSALIEMYPFEMQKWLIPLSGFFMGMMAVVAEYAGELKLSVARRNRWFFVTLAIFAIALLTLLPAYLFTVTRIESRSLATVTGTLTVPQQLPGSGCTCVPGAPAGDCVRKSLDPDNTRRCFGPTRVVLATLALAILYLVLTGSLAAAVGLLVIAQRRARRRE